MILSWPEGESNPIFFDMQMPIRRRDIDTVLFEQFTILGMGCLQRPCTAQNFWQCAFMVLKNVHNYKNRSAKLHR